MKLETLTQVIAERAARRPVIVITDTANGEQRLVKAKDIATDPLGAELSKQLRMGKSGMIESGGKKLFLNVYAPTARLVIVGAVHISQALAPLARSLDYDVTVVDPRTAFASPERFPDVPLIAEWPDVALPPLNIDHYTAFVAVTHDPKIDDPALLHAFARDCFYIGALGSRKTHAKRAERLKAQGASDADIARIHAPIGLSIGAVSPSEIAVSMWQLPSLIEVAEKAGLSAARYKMQYALLISRPMLLMAMVILAATVSLRSFRSGGTQTMVVTGMVGGIGFFLLTEVSRQVGVAGLVSAATAAWMPISLALLVSITVLLHQEDG